MYRVPVRQGDRYARAGVDRTLDAYASVVQVHELVHDGEPEARAGAAAPSARTVPAEEGLEDAGKVVLRNTAARIGHHKFECAARRGHHGHGDLALLGMLYRIFH